MTFKVSKIHNSDFFCKGSDALWTEAFDWGMNRRICAYQQLKSYACVQFTVSQTIGAHKFGHAQKSVPMYGDVEKQGLFDLYHPVTVVGVTLHDKKNKNKKSERNPSMEPWSSAKARRADCSAELSRKRHCPFALSSETGGLRFHSSVQTLALTDAPSPLVHGSVVSTP